MKIKYVAILLASLMVVAQSASAKDSRDFGQIYVECGLGGLIAQHTPWAAVITNVTWDLGTTAISSELSSPDSCKGQSSQSAAFIHESYEPLAMDLAHGQGEHLSALMSIPGCDAAVQPALAKALRTDFAKMVGQPDYSKMNQMQKSEGLYNIFQKNLQAQPFAGSCNIG